MIDQLFFSNHLLLRFYILVVIFLEWLNMVEIWHFIRNFGGYVYHTGFTWSGIPARTGMHRLYVNVFFINDMNKCDRGFYIGMLKGPTF
jgi:hypothetical protein